MGDPAGAHPVYSGDGSRVYPGRWNEKGQPVIYASEHYSTALLETVARTGEMPRNQHSVDCAKPQAPGVSQAALWKSIFRPESRTKWSRRTACTVGVMSTELLREHSALHGIQSGDRRF